MANIMTIISILRKERCKIPFRMQAVAEESYRTVRETRQAELRQRYGDLPPFTFYLTFAVTNISEAVQSGTEARVTKRMPELLQRGPRLMPKLLGLIASATVDKSKVMLKLSRGFSRTLPTKLRELVGLAVDMRTVFVSGCLAVVECVATDVQMGRLIKSMTTKRPQIAPALRCVLGCLHCFALGDDLEAFVQPRLLEKV